MNSGARVFDMHHFCISIGMGCSAEHACVPHTYHALKRLLCTQRDRQQRVVAEGEAGVSIDPWPWQCTGSAQTLLAIGAQSRRNIVASRFSNCATVFCR